MEPLECRRLLCNDEPISGESLCQKHKSELRLCSKCKTNLPVVDGLCHTCIRVQTQELYEWQRRHAELRPFAEPISNRGSGSCSLTQT